MNSGRTKSSERFAVKPREGEGQVSPQDWPWSLTQETHSEMTIPMVLLPRTQREAEWWLHGSWSSCPCRPKEVISFQGRITATAPCGS